MRQFIIYIIHTIHDDTRYVHFMVKLKYLNNITSPHSLIAVTIRLSVRERRRRLYIIIYGSPMFFPTFNLDWTGARLVQYLDRTKCRHDKLSTRQNIAPRTLGARRNFFKLLPILIGAVLLLRVDGFCWELYN